MSIRTKIAQELVRMAESLVARSPNERQLRKLKDGLSDYFENSSAMDWFDEPMLEEGTIQVFYDSMTNMSDRDIKRAIEKVAKNAGFKVSNVDLGDIGEAFIEVD